MGRLDGSPAIEGPQPQAVQLAETPCESAALDTLSSSVHSQGDRGKPDDLPWLAQLAWRRLTARCEPPILRRHDGPGTHPAAGIDDRGGRGRGVPALRLRFEQALPPLRPDPGERYGARTLESAHIEGTFRGPGTERFPALFFFATGGEHKNTHRAGWARGSLQSSHGEVRLLGGVLIASVAQLGASPVP